MGKQYIKLKRRIRISWYSLLLLLALAFLIVLAVKTGMWISVTVIGVLVTWVGVKILADLAGGMYALERAFKMLPSGVPLEEKKVSEEKVPEVSVEKMILNRQS